MNDMIKDGSQLNNWIWMIKWYEPFDANEVKSEGTYEDHWVGWKRPHRPARHQQVSSAGRGGYSARKFRQVSSTDWIPWAGK